MSTQEKSLEAADAILDDLRGRRGVGDELDSISGDSDIWEEIRQTLASIIMEKMS